LHIFVYFEGFGIFLGFGYMLYTRFIYTVALCDG